MLAGLLKERGARRCLGWGAIGFGRKLVEQRFGELPEARACVGVALKVTRHRRFRIRKFGQAGGVKTSLLQYRARVHKGLRSEFRLGGEIARGNLASAHFKFLDFAAGGCWVFFNETHIVWNLIRSNAAVTGCAKCNLIELCTRS